MTIAKTFDHLENWKDEFLVQAGINDEVSYPFVVLGNKCDLPSHSVDRKRVAEWIEGLPNDTPYFQTSAKESTEVEAAFHAAAQLAITRIPEDHPYVCNLEPVGKAKVAVSQNQNTGCCG